MAQGSGAALQKRFFTSARGFFQSGSGLHTKRPWLERIGTGLLNRHLMQVRILPGAPTCKISRSRSSAERAASSYLAGRVFDSSRDRQCRHVCFFSGELTGRGPATPAKRSVPFWGMRIVLSALRQLRVWHRWMCAGLPNRTGEIVPRGPLQDQGVSLPARISVLQTEEAGSAPARPATPCLLPLFLPLGRSVRRRTLNP